MATVFRFIPYTYSRDVCMCSVVYVYNLFFSLLRTPWEPLRLDGAGHCHCHRRAPVQLHTHCILRERSTKATTAKAFGGSGCVNRALVFWWPSGRTFRPKRSKNSSLAVFLCHRRRRTTSDFRFTDIIFVRVNVAVRISVYGDRIAYGLLACSRDAPHLGIVRLVEKEHQVRVSVFIVYAIMRMCIIL